MKRADLIERLLEDGRRWVEPTEQVLAAMARLEQAGLVRSSVGRGFVCFDPADEACQEHPNRSCGALVSVCDEVAVCRACGAEHEWPEERTARDVVEVRRDRAGVEAWLCAAVARLDPDARRLRAGVAWQVLVGEQDAELVWLDEHTPEALTTRAYAVGRSVVYVVAEPRRWRGRFVQEPWLEPLSLATWVVDGPAAVRRALASRRAGAQDERAWSAMRAARPRAVAMPLGARVLEVGADRATLDGHEVVGRDGVAVLALLRVLAQRWREDVADQKASTDHCTWTVDELRLAVGESGPTPTRGTVQRQLQRVRAGIRDRYQRVTGIRLEEDAVVEHVRGEGYRIHPTGVLVRVV